MGSIQPMALRACYAMSGTHVAYAAIRPISYSASSPGIPCCSYLTARPLGEVRKYWRRILRYQAVLTSDTAVPGSTDVGYCATRKSFGMMMITIHKMLVGDVFKFLFVYLVSISYACPLPA
eukprot:1728229-Rhodomonas_salina.3